MTVAVSLPDAAVIAADNLYTLYIGGTLKTKSTAFWQSIQDTFPEQQVDSHPVSNWLTLIANTADQMPVANVPYRDLDSMIEFVYRLCFVASQLNSQTPKLVSNVQAAALLAAYNAQFS